MNQSPGCAPITRTERLCSLGNRIASERAQLRNLTQFEKKIGGLGAPSWGEKSMESTGSSNTH